VRGRGFMSAREDSGPKNFLPRAQEREVLRKALNQERGISRIAYSEDIS